MIDLTKSFTRVIVSGWCDQVRIQSVFEDVKAWRVASLLWKFIPIADRDLLLTVFFPFMCVSLIVCVLVSLQRDAIGWSVICDCNNSLSYSLVCYCCWFRRCCLFACINFVVFMRFGVIYLLLLLFKTAESRAKSGQ